MNLFQHEEFSFTIATDVDNPLCGKQGAAYTFAPQKGARSEMVEILDQHARIFAKESANKHGYDYSQQPGAGAAGGLGYAFMQYLHANRLSGATLLMDMIEFDQLLTHADLVFTGEGKSDKQTLMGKLPFAIMQRAKLSNVPTILLAGQVFDKDSLLQAGFYDVLCINPSHLSIDEAMNKENALKNIQQTTKFFLKTHTNLF
jgi:glycerate kinase